MRLAILLSLLLSASTFAEPLSWTLVIKEHSDAALKQLDEQIAGARAVGEPVMVELFASWCAACRVLEHGALSDSEVIRALSGFIKIRVDVSEPDEFTDAVRRRFDAQVLPTITFISMPGTMSQVAGTPSANQLLRKVRALSKIEGHT
jgi:thiol:disulfide interchange protein DsbD